MFSSTQIGLNTDDLWLMVATSQILEGELHECEETPMVLAVGTKDQCESFMDEQISYGDYPEIFLCKVKLRSFAAYSFEEDKSDDDDGQRVPDVQAIPVM